MFVPTTALILQEANLAAKADSAAEPKALKRSKTREVAPIEVAVPRKNMDKAV